MATRLNFIEKLKNNGNAKSGDNISKLLQSFLLSKWREIEMKKLEKNYEEEGIIV